MGKSFHKHWNGFIQIRDENKRIIAAKCESCGRLLKKRDSDALLVHKKVCKGKIDLPTDANEGSSIAQSQESTFSENPGKFLYVMEVSQTNKETIFNSPQSSNNDEIVNCTSNEEKHTLLLKFFLSCEIEPEMVTSAHTINLFKALDSTYQLPSVEELKGKVSSIARANNIKLNFSQELLSHLCLLTHCTDDQLYVVCVALTNKMSYFYVLDILLKKNQNIILELETFCDICVKKVLDLYKLKVSYVIYDCNENLSASGNVNGNKYYKICCLSVLINNLRTKHEPFVITSSEDLVVMQNYYANVDNLNSKLSESNCCLGEAMDYIFDFVDKNSTVLNLHVTDIVLKFTGAVALTANFLHYKYFGRLFLSHLPLMQSMQEFLEETLHDEAFNSLADYKNKSGTFRRLFEANHENKRFWHIAKMHHEALGEFALKISDLPAITKKINMSRFTKMQSKSFIGESESSKALLYSILSCEA